MQRLIVICGAPGTGKTTVSSLLATKLGMCCLHKDSIKESLYEALSYATLEESRLAGAAAIHILHRLAEEQLSLGSSLIVEAPFTHAEDLERFEMWEQTYHVTLSLFVFHTVEEERIRRKRERVRHQSHHDNERTQGLVPTYAHMAHRAVYLDTSHTLPSELVDNIISSI
jgi:predicted kinase